MGTASLCTLQSCRDLHIGLANTRTSIRVGHAQIEFLTGAEIGGR